MGNKSSKKKGTTESAAELEESSNLTVDDFKLLKVLGKGSFGKVMLCQKKDEGRNGPLYAMKTLKKAELLNRHQVEHTNTERQILQHIDHPFLTHIRFAFQTPDKLYMIIDYFSGGELFHWLKKKRRFSEKAARLYAAEITLALGCLHGHDVVYRDLKPENILLDEDGHLRLTDFGLSKKIEDSGTATFCGTPEYLAPEIIANRGHGMEVDWWSFGTLLHELMCGLPPFYDANMHVMYQKIQNQPLRQPSFLKENAKAFLRGLLTRDVSQRLGANGVEEVKASPFFDELDWDRVYNKDYVPELQPKLEGGKNSAKDASHFDAEFTNETAIDSVVTTSLTASQSDKAVFDDFTFKGDSKMG
mmetsp:Transcript_38275/g.51837  ORF Transcript_38275/g.51837 Transcript_38275/m.51837 type:complete len:360 (-) Transcript_38275:329-1408(-)|eukprot:CAMPEP_0185771430 /NCGR_PEP_ID=MMETSP1174-20130828/64300_1 /TAXON_ID=35687 /ORGANISM="Dictyocha speculum, Strain CCMP1381" /LENGTH=359 /DNA_ID=CAMNT_0028457303 /DNA_START=55 /DNA_END=1134 /DNA_ORIENTATION=+